jgi:hypothetical protein
MAEFLSGVAGASQGAPQLLAFDISSWTGKESAMSA